MAQMTTLKLPTGEEATVIYPDGKKLKNLKYQADQHNVVVFYQSPHTPDIAECSPSDTLLFSVVSALIPGL